MDIIAGVMTAAAIVGLGAATCQGRSLPFYSTVLIVIALAYVLFAVMEEGLHTILVETAVAAGFVAVAVVAARWANPRFAAGLLAAGLVGHGGYDLAHHAIVTNPVVPVWWPLYCAVVDVGVGGWVGWLFIGNRSPNSSIPLRKRERTGMNAYRTPGAGRREW